MQTKLTRGEQALIDLASVTQVATVNVAVQNARTAVNALKTLLAASDDAAIEQHLATIRQSLSAITDSIS